MVDRHRYFRHMQESNSIDGARFQRVEDGEVVHLSLNSGLVHFAQHTVAGDIAARLTVYSNTYQTYFLIKLYRHIIILTWLDRCQVQSRRSDDFHNPECEDLTIYQYIWLPYNYVHDDQDGSNGYPSMGTATSAILQAGIKNWPRRHHSRAILRSLEGVSGLWGSNQVLNNTVSYFSIVSTIS